MNHPQANLFEQFLRERTYLKNVTPSTLIWYRVAFKNYGVAFPDETLPTRVSLQQFVIGLRERHIKPVTCNSLPQELVAEGARPPTPQSSV